MQTFFVVYGKSKIDHVLIEISSFTKEEYAKEYIQKMEGRNYYDMFYEEVEGETICAHCGEIIYTHDFYETDDGDICEDCYYDNYATCISCDNIYHQENMVFSRYGDAICQDCYNEYYATCYHCEDILSIEYLSYIDQINDYVCENCFYNHYTICDSCCEVITQEEANITHRGTYCEYCLPENITIMPYGYKPKQLFFHKMNDEEKPLFLGVELEMDQGGQKDENAKQILDVANEYKEQHIYIKEDGSLTRGFEIVSMPCSYEYHLKKFPWKAILEKAIKLGYSSNTTNTCGLHVHIDRKYLGETEKEQEENIMKLLLLVELFSEKMKMIARRGSVSYCKYYVDRYTPKSANDLYEYAKKTNINKKLRYYSLNMQNKHTIELRIFRGTLSYNTLMATLQFVKYLVTYAISQPLEKLVNDLSWDKFISGISVGEYRLLIGYLNKLNLWTQKERRVQRA